MKMLITKRFHFDAAPQLTDYHGKCERMHGHTYRLDVTVEGPVLKNGIVIDFALLKNAVKKHIFERLDHQNLNNFFKNPTAENVTTWIFKELKPLAKLLKQVAKSKEYLEDIQCYYPKGQKGGPNQTDFSKIRLVEIKLYEGEGASVAYRA